MTADERALILRRYTALGHSGGRSKSDFVAQISKEHGVARSYPWKLFNKMLTRASTSPRKSPGRPGVYGAAYDTVMKIQVAKARSQRQVSSSKTIVAAMV